VLARRQEVADDEPRQQFDEAGRFPTGQVRLDERDEEDRGQADDPRQAGDGELVGGLARLGGEHQCEVIVGAQLDGGLHDAAHEQVLEADCVVDVGAEPGQELLGVTHPQGVEEHVLAAGEQPVQRRSGHAGVGGDVVDRDLAHAPLLATPLGGVEHGVLGNGPHA